MYGSPHDEIIELKVQRACKSWTGDNFEMPEIRRMTSEQVKLDAHLVG